MKNVRSLLILFLTLVMLVTSVACGSQDATDPVDTLGETHGETLGEGEDTSAEETTSLEETTAADEATARYTYKHIVIVGVDGAGAFFREADTPNLDEIFANGAVTYEAITATPSISAQSWGSLLHGVTPEFHGLNNSIAENQTYSPDSDYPSFFRVVHEQMPEASLASFCNWNPINVGIIEDNIGVYKDHRTSDLGVTKAAIDYVKDEIKNGNGAPTVLFLHYDEADAAGHNAGYGTKTHLNKIGQQDGWIRRIYDVYAEKGLLEDTLFIVTSDHGGSGTSHGGDTDTEMKIMFAATGKTVEQGTVGDMGIRDIASIVLYALGLEAHQPQTWTSRVPSGLFEGVEAGDRPVYTLPETDRTHVNVATPTQGSQGYISNFITDRNLTTYLTFDGDITDECGAATTKGGKLYFVEGYFGEGAALEDGYVSIPNYAPGTDSFSVSLWVKTTGVTSDPSLFSNKDWRNGRNVGYILSINDKGMLKFNVGTGSDRVDMETRLADDYVQGWMHIALVVDRAAGVVKVSTDFGKFQTVTLTDALKDASFNAFDTLNIGQDGTGSYEASLAATVDEFMIFDGVLTEEHLASLAAYYGQ